MSDRAEERRGFAIRRRPSHSAPASPKTVPLLWGGPATGTCCRALDTSSCSGPRVLSLRCCLGWGLLLPHPLACLRALRTHLRPSERFPLPPTLLFLQKGRRSDPSSSLRSRVSHRQTPEERFRQSSRCHQSPRTSRPSKGTHRLLRWPRHQRAQAPHPQPTRVHRRPRILRPQPTRVHRRPRTLRPQPTSAHRRLWTRRRRQEVRRPRSRPFLPCQPGCLRWRWGCPPRQGRPRPQTLRRRPRLGGQERRVRETPPWSVTFLNRGDRPGGTSTAGRALRTSSFFGVAPDASIFFARIPLEFRPLRTACRGWLVGQLRSNQVAKPDGVSWVGHGLRRLQRSDR